MQTIIDFLTSVPIHELLLIIFAKAIEVSISTLRGILIIKGYRTKGTLLSFIEILLWVFIASTVINGVSEAPIKGIAYGIGFSAGVFIGSVVEAKLAFGQVLIQVITSKEQGLLVTNALRSNGYGVTSIDAAGRDSDRMVLMSFANRKSKYAILKLIESIDEHAMIVANDVNPLKGGYIKAAQRKLLK